MYVPGPGLLLRRRASGTAVSHWHYTKEGETGRGWRQIIIRSSKDDTIIVSQQRTRHVDCENNACSKSLATLTGQSVQQHSDIPEQRHPLRLLDESSSDTHKWAFSLLSRVGLQYLLLDKACFDYNNTVKAKGANASMLNSETGVLQTRWHGVDKADARTTPHRIGQAFAKGREIEHSQK